MRRSGAPNWWNACSATPAAISIGCRRRESATHNRFGAATVKSRSTGSGARNAVTISNRSGSLIAADA